MFELSITFPKGPTIMDDDKTPVTITLVEHTPERVTKLQQAALLLGATSVEITKNEK